MSRNTIIIIVAAIALVIVLFGIFGSGGGDVPAPEADVVAPETQPSN